MGYRHILQHGWKHVKRKKPEANTSNDSKQMMFRCRSTSAAGACHTTENIVSYSQSLRGGVQHIIRGQRMEKAQEKEAGVMWTAVFRFQGEKNDKAGSNSWLKASWLQNSISSRVSGMSLLIGVCAWVVRQGSRGLEDKKRPPNGRDGATAVACAFLKLPLWLGSAILGGEGPLGLAKASHTDENSHSWCTLGSRSIETESKIVDLGD